MEKRAGKNEGKDGKQVANPNLSFEIVDIQPMIQVIRGQQVMLDKDLAMLYGVETKRLNEQVKRNIERFPDDFMFRLTKSDMENLRSHFATSSWGGTRQLPYAFTEQGIAMLSSVLKSQTAVDANISPVQGIFYDGQVFDAYRFVSDLIRKAQHSVVLIDNYVDDTVLTLLDKRGDGVKALIYTRHVSNHFQLDIARHNAQYPVIDIIQFNKAHDRFLLIDEEVYHIGASIKDLGKKWFGFTLMRDITASELVSKIK